MYGTICRSQWHQVGGDPLHPKRATRLRHEKRREGGMGGAGVPEEDAQRSGGRGRGGRPTGTLALTEEDGEAAAGDGNGVVVVP